MFLEQVRIRVMSELQAAGARPVDLDIFAPSRQKTLPGIRTLLDRYASEQNMDHYPWETPVNILRPYLVSNHHAEVTANGTFRFYRHLPSQIPKTRVGGLVRELPPKGVDCELLERQALTFIERLKGSGLLQRLKSIFGDNLLVDGLEQDSLFVRISSYMGQNITALRKT